MGGATAGLTDPDTAIRVLFIDDDPLALTALRMSLGEGSGIEIDCLWGTPAEIVDGFAERRPHAVLIDLVLSACEIDGIDLARKMKDREPSCCPIILTSSTSADSALRAWNAGIGGYLSKHYLLRDVHQLAGYIRSIIEGVVIYQVDPRRVDGISLSDRELEVLRLKASGLERSGIADQLYVSARTVDSHIAHVRSKLGAATIPEAVRIAQERGLLG